VLWDAYPMLKHEDIWQAIDRLAARHGLSASGLAKRGGLDPTTFNRSKRATPDGKMRWPSTESIAKVLEATGSSFAEFVSLADAVGEAGRSPVRRIPVIGYGQADRDGLFTDTGHPAGDGWDELDFPHIDDPHAYALEVSGAGLEPVYRDGDILIVSPAAQIRRGDRLLIRPREGELMVRQLVRLTATRLEVQTLNAAPADGSLQMSAVSWMARIMWVSQ